MPNPEFEKQVQQKLEELSFTPSGDVWERVKEQLPEKKRRRLFWLWLLLIPAATIGYYGLHSGARQSSTTAVSTSKQENATTNKKKEQPLYVEDNLNLSHTNPEKADKLNNQNKEKAEESVQDDDVSVDVSSAVSAKDKNNHTKSGSGVTANKIFYTATKGNRHPTSHSQHRYIKEQVMGEDNDSDVSDEISALNRFRSDEADLAILSLPPLSLIRQPFDLNFPVVDNTHHAKQTHKAEHEKRPWNFGFTLAAGESALKQPNPAAQNSPLYNAFIAAPQFGQVENPKHGFSLSVGGVVTHPISKRFEISIGLNYQYYSTITRTGQSGNFLPSAISVNMTDTAARYYRPGTSVSNTNKYHIVQIPLSVAWQVNKSKQLPLFIEGGFTGGYIFSSDALFYDKLAGIFYRNTDVLQKLQLSGNAAISIGYNVNAHTQLRIGPYVSYQFTNFYKNSTGTNAHLFFGGVKLVVLPWKK